MAAPTIEDVIQEAEYMAAQARIHRVMQGWFDLLAGVAGAVASWRPGQPVHLLPHDNYPDAAKLRACADYLRSHAAVAEAVATETETWAAATTREALRKEKR